MWHRFKQCFLGYSCDPYVVEKPVLELLRVIADLQFVERGLHITQDGYTELEHSKCPVFAIAFAVQRDSLIWAE